MLAAGAILRKDRARLAHDRSGIPSGFRWALGLSDVGRTARKRCGKESCAAERAKVGQLTDLRCLYLSRQRSLRFGTKPGLLHRAGSRVRNLKRPPPPGRAARICPPQKRTRTSLAPQTHPEMTHPTCQVEMSLLRHFGGVAYLGR